MELSAPSSPSASLSPFQGWASISGLPLSEPCCQMKGIQISRNQDAPSAFFLLLPHFPQGPWKSLLRWLNVSYMAATFSVFWFIWVTVYSHPRGLFGFARHAAKSQLPAEKICLLVDLSQCFPKILIVLSLKKKFKLYNSTLWLEDTNLNRFLLEGFLSPQYLNKNCEFPIQYMLYFTKSFRQQNPFCADFLSKIHFKKCTLKISGLSDAYSYARLC